MKKRLRILSILSIVFLYLGCTSTREITEIRKRVVVPPVIEKTLPAELSDSVIVAVEVVSTTIDNKVKKDTTAQIEFRPDPSLLKKINELRKEKKLLGTELKSLGEFYFKINPDTIEVWDTLKTVQIVEKIIETPLLSKVGLVLVGIVIAIILLVLVRNKL